MNDEQLAEWQLLAEAAAAIDRRLWYAVAVPALVAEVERLRQELAEPTAVGDDDEDEIRRMADAAYESAKQRFFAP